MIREYGSTARTFKSSLLWIVIDNAQSMREESRKILAWQAISDESGDLNLDDVQRKQLVENVQKARRDLKESIWRAYRHVLILGKDNKLKVVDLGLVHSSAADTPISNVINRLSADGDMEKGVSPSFLVRNWPPAFEEWSTKSVRDAFYASPVFPRLINQAAVKDTIVRGVEEGLLAYVGKITSGKYQPFSFRRIMSPSDIEISDDMFVITGDTAQAYIQKELKLTGPIPSGNTGTSLPKIPPPNPASTETSSPTASTQSQLELSSSDSTARSAGIRWTGDVPPQKWMNFYTRVLTKFATTPGLKLTVQFDFSPSEGVSTQSLDETRSALRELGLDDQATRK